jgi:ribosomal protein S18 acetylase RimI-like enzyme
MRVTTLAALDAAAQRDAFNRVYEGYLIPLHLTTEQVAQHFDLNDIARAHSPVWLDDDGAVLALAALGVRGTRGWIGGFGVAPPARGLGLGRRLIAAVLAEAAALGLRQVRLEVLAGNTAASRVYARAGFVHRRWLRTFERAGAAPPPAGAAGAVAELAAGAALAWAAGQRREPPAWQREPESLRHLPALRALALGTPAAPLAVAVYSAGAADAHLLDLTGPPAALWSLLAALVARFPGGRLRVGNEPEASPLCALLAANGWQEVIRQREMSIDLLPAR